MSMNGAGGFVGGCPFGGGRFTPSKLPSSSHSKKTSRQSKTSVRRQVRRNPYADLANTAPYSVGGMRRDVY